MFPSSSFATTSHATPQALALSLEVYRNPFTKPEALVKIREYWRQAGFANATQVRKSLTPSA